MTWGQSGYKINPKYKMGHLTPWRYAEAGGLCKKDGVCVCDLYNFYPKKNKHKSPPTDI